MFYDVLFSLACSAWRFLITLPLFQTNQDLFDLWSRWSSFESWVIWSNGQWPALHIDQPSIHPEIHSVVMWRWESFSLWVVLWSCVKRNIRENKELSFSLSSHGRHFDLAHEGKTNYRWRSIFVWKWINLLSWKWFPAFRSHRCMCSFSSHSQLGS